LDWILIRNPGHLQRVVATYVGHYNMGRPHRGIDLDIPITPAEPLPVSSDQLRRVKRTDLLGGLVHEYRHAA
jgi:hypothetical protein